jgi:hypothetical protein
MGFDLALAGVSIVSLIVAVWGLWLAHQINQTSESRHFEQRIRALEDGMLNLEHYAAARRELPGRMMAIEYQLTRLQESVERLEGLR